MTEIRIDVDLSHPQERVWRALTDPPVINAWFPNTGFVATDDGRFTVRPDGLNGLDGPVRGEIASVEAPHRLVLRLAAPRLHTLMTVTLRPTAIGCRLSIAQRGFLGTQGAIRRRTLRHTYTELIERRLIPAIERLATADPEASPVRETKRNTAGPFLRVPRQSSGSRSEPPRSASAPGLASHVRAPARPPGVSPIPGFGAAVLGARAVPRPVGVVRADEVARLAEAEAGELGTSGYDPLEEPPMRHRSTVDRSTAGRVHAAVDLVQVSATGARRQFTRLAGWLAEVPRWPAERRSQAIAGLAALLLLIALIALLLAKATATRPADPPQVGGGPREPGQAGVPAQQRPPGNAQPDGNPGASAAAVGPVVASSPADVRASVVAAGRLSGTYRTERQYVSEYAASLTITNDTAASVTGWSATLRMPLLTLVVYDVENAVLSQTGTTVTFTPLDANRTVPPGQSVVVRFQVKGVGVPTECAVDGTTCAGIAE